MPRQRWTTLGIVLGFFLALHGTVAGADSTEIRLSMIGDGIQPVVPTGSDGFMVGSFHVDVDANELSYHIVMSGLSSPEMFTVIHGPADPGEGGSSLFTLPDGDVKVGVWNYDESLEADLLAGRLYLDAHTDMFPDGELRGQIAPLVCAIDGAQESPPVVTDARGFGIFTIDTASNELDYYIAFENLSTPEFAAHIHGPAVHGLSDGPILHELPLGSPKVGTWSYGEEMEEALLGGLMYVNIHSQDFNLGEIRGQIVSSVTPIENDQEVPPNGSPARGWACFSVDLAASTLGYDIRYNDLSDAESASHIHGPALPGEEAPPLVDLPLGDRKIGSTPIPAGNMADFYDCLLYVNIHSASFPGGEIRGQAIPTRLTDPPTFIRGDADADGLFNGLLDGLRILNFGFVPGSPPPPCLEAADADGDGVFNGLIDGLYVLLHQFSGGPEPAPPYPACGIDPEFPGLGCASSPGCP